MQRNQAAEQKGITALYKRVTTSTLTKYAIRRLGQHGKEFSLSLIQFRLLLVCGLRGVEVPTQFLVQVV